MGNYAAFTLPFYGYSFKSKENSITEISTVDFYTFLIFMTNARTPVAMYWGLLGLFVVTVIAFTRKNI